jgi:hypothetical protein
VMPTATFRTVLDIRRLREIIANPRSIGRSLALLRRRTRGGPPGVGTYRTDIRVGTKITHHKTILRNSPFFPLIGTVFK